MYKYGETELCKQSVTPTNARVQAYIPFHTVLEHDNLRAKTFFISCHQHTVSLAKLGESQSLEHIQGA